MTGRLTVSYRAPSPLYVELKTKGWIEKIEGRKIFTRGTLHHGDTLCCEAEVLFISMPIEHMDRLRKGRDLTQG